METPMAQGPPRLPRGSLRHGGWVLALALVLVTAATLWRVFDMLSSRGSRAVGDGHDPASYGFDLGTCLVPRDLIVGGGVPRDGIPVLDLPPLWTVAQVESLAGVRGAKYLVPGDRVIGVVRNGQARAYPTLILDWHEVVNDTLGGCPILVTYSPLCDAVAVFDRRVPPGSEALRFGHSGLLFDSDLVLYDRRPGHRGESLWSQLQARAITGPAADSGRELTLLPCSFVRWADWRARHPATTILARDPARTEEYARSPYSSYRGSDILRFPARPLPASGARPLKTPCAVVFVANRPVVYPLPLVASRADRQGVWRTTQQGRPLIFTYRDRPPTLFVDAEGDAGPPAVLYSSWFAWFATHAGRVVEGR